MYNPKLNHMCLKINCLVFCEDNGACTMKCLYSINLLFVVFFYSEGGEGVTCFMPTMLQALVHEMVLANVSAPMSVVHCYK